MAKLCQFCRPDAPYANCAGETNLAVQNEAVDKRTMVHIVGMNFVIIAFVSVEMCGNIGTCLPDRCFYH